MNHLNLDENSHPTGSKMWQDNCDGVAFAEPAVKGKMEAQRLTGA